MTTETVNEHAVGQSRSTVGLGNASDKARIFTNKGTWGNSIQWTNFDKRSVSGHSTPVPSVGDYLDYKMQSGRTFRFRFDKVERMRDPADMFFGKVSDIGYTDELPNANITGG